MSPLNQQRCPLARDSFAISSQTEIQHQEYTGCTDSLSAPYYLSHQQHQTGNVTIEIENSGTQLARSGISVLFIRVPALWYNRK